LGLASVKWHGKVQFEPKAFFTLSQFISKESPIEETVLILIGFTSANACDIGYRFVDGGFKTD
jgi:hypothetical protein